MGGGDEDLQVPRTGAVLGGGDHTNKQTNKYRGQAGRAQVGFGG